MPHAHLLKFGPDVDPQGFVSVSRAAKLLDVSPKTLYDWIANGKLRAYKIGKSVRLKVPEFLRWIDIHAKAS